MTSESSASLGSMSEAIQKSGDDTKLDHVELGSASSTRPGARASQADPQILLEWMETRGPGPIAVKTIGDSGPRAFRRRADMDVAIAVLVERGVIEEMSSKPRTLRLTSGRSTSAGALLPGPEEIVAKHAALMAERHDLPDRAAAYIAAVDLCRWMLERLGSKSSEFDRLGEMADDHIMEAFG